MKNFSTWMIVAFVIMFWGFRIFIAVGTELNMDLTGMEPLNQQVEVMLLFTTLVAIILIIKRKMFGGLIYLLTYGLYFGTYIMNNLQNIMLATEGNIEMNTLIGLIISIVGVILPVAVILDLLFDKNRKNNPKNKQTDWFYANEKFDRELDERSDKNNYRTM